jgi:hypothetical protein
MAARWHAVSLCAVATVMAGASVFAQFPQLPRLKLPGGADDLVWERLLQRDPPVTTNLSDALTEIAYLDDYDPTPQVPLASFGADAQGIYRLFGGEFRFTAESYCLRPGAYARSSGNGYAYAALRGPEGDIVHDVMQHSIRARDISQPTIQMLLWSILSRTKLSAMSPELRRAAERLLDKKQQSSLDGGALGVIPDDVRARIQPRLPEPVRETLEVENRVRALAARAGTNFDEWRTLAVLQGAPAAHAGDRVIPSGRWSYDPAGYFVRFDPASFLQTRVDISVPPAIRVARDARGRIYSIADRIRRLRITYDDASNKPLGAQAYGVRFDTIEYFDADAAAKVDAPVMAWKARGWTLVGTPASSGSSVSSAFTGLAERVDHASARARDVGRALSSLSSVTRGRSPASEDNTLADIANVREALQAVQNESPVRTIWRSDLDAFLVQAWESAFAARAGVAVPGADPPFGPAGVVAVPGSVTAQRLGMSPRPSGDGTQPRCKGEDSADGAEGAVARGMNVGLDQVSVYQDGGLEKIFARTRNGCALPDNQCLAEAIDQGRVPPGSLQGANDIIVGAIQRAGNVTRVTLRVVNVETGEIVATGVGDAMGTGPAAVQQATGTAMKSISADFPLGGC